jgi:hypothetical protein
VRARAVFYLATHLLLSPMVVFDCFNNKFDECYKLRFWFWFTIAWYEFDCTHLLLSFDKSEQLLNTNFASAIWNLTRFTMAKIAYHLLKLTTHKFSTKFGVCVTNFL